MTSNRELVPLLSRESEVSANQRRTPGKIVVIAHGFERVESRLESISCLLRVPVVEHGTSERVAARAAVGVVDWTESISQLKKRQPSGKRKGASHVESERIGCR